MKMMKYKCPSCGSKLVPYRIPACANQNWYNGKCARCGHWESHYDVFEVGVEDNVERVYKCRYDCEPMLAGGQPR
jgi:predicted RNA-binding Zn-ribbon protein involved in translation (DUF1610 family)